MRAHSVAATTGLLVCLTACGSSNAPSPSASASPGATAARETQRPLYVGPIGSLTRAELDVENGATTITVAGDDLGDNLYHAEIAQPGATLNVTQDTPGVVRLRIGQPGSGTSHMRITVSSRIPWDLRINGGTQQTLLDLRQVQVAAVRVSAGAQELTLYLPRPRGTVPVVLTGGESDLIIHVVNGAATQLEVSAGARTITVDGHTDTDAAQRTYTSDVYAAATDRYHIQSQAGAGTIRLERY
jgi:hypothetical protein